MSGRSQFTEICWPCLVQPNSENESNSSEQLAINKHAKSFRSTSRPLTCGVPQGSILGPILFALYINDLTRSSTDAEFVLFADDTTVIWHNYSLLDLKNQAQMGLDQIQNWLVSNKLSLNIQKTNFMLFGPPPLIASKNSFKVTINNLEVAIVKEAKFLGLMIDEKLSWESHIKKVNKTINFSIFTLSRIKRLLSISTKRSLYHSLICSHLAYGLEHWGGCMSQPHVSPPSQSQKVSQSSVWYQIR